MSICVGSRTHGRAHPIRTRKDPEGLGSGQPELIANMFFDPWMTPTAPGTNSRERPCRGGRHWII
ncbi:hypothetical protein D779_1312 [Imhoffiella purpurea]|uniref:Uncharacterized protein n=1 Tax=Imhoffiella purpurea TaxID=1249627 RepID=W9VYT4_9GAMM|nr:hypothetical protein D779_1312 [Imhoffiella purpurea]